MYINFSALVPVMSQCLEHIDMESDSKINQATPNTKLRRLEFTDPSLKAKGLEGTSGIILRLLYSTEKVRDAHPESGRVACRIEGLASRPGCLHL